VTTLADVFRHYTGVLGTTYRGIQRVDLWGGQIHDTEKG